MLWEELSDDLLLRVLEHAMVRRGGLKRWRGALRGVSRRWRALHDGACTRLEIWNGVTDEGMHVLCARLPALTNLDLSLVTSLTAEGLRAVGGRTTLIILDLLYCPNVTDAVLRELRDLTALAKLHPLQLLPRDGRGGVGAAWNDCAHHALVQRLHPRDGRGASTPYFPACAHQALPRRHLHHSGRTERTQGCPACPHLLLVISRAAPRPTAVHALCQIPW